VSKHKYNTDGETNHFLAIPERKGGGGAIAALERKRVKDGSLSRLRFRVGIVLGSLGLGFWWLLALPLAHFVFRRMGDWV
jgi:hypothetical protein